LKLFSPDGRETAKYFADYDSGHLLVRGNQLLVTQWDGDSLRIYERI
jgi:hypothetical protein